MAQITLNPDDVTLSISRFNYTKNGNITWTKPTLTSDAIVTSITLTGSINSVSYTHLTLPTTPYV